MLILLAGIEFLQKVEELTLPAVISVASAPINFYSGMLSTVPGCCPAFRDYRKSGQLQNGISGQLRPE
jgi:hypothetical protein